MIALTSAAARASDGFTPAMPMPPVPGMPAPDNIIVTARSPIALTVFGPMEPVKMIQGECLARQTVAQQTVRPAGIHSPRRDQPADRQPQACDTAIGPQLEPQSPRPSQRPCIKVAGKNFIGNKAWWPHRQAGHGVPGLGVPGMSGIGASCPGARIVRAFRLGRAFLFNLWLENFLDEFEQGVGQPIISHFLWSRALWSRARAIVILVSILGPVL